MDNANRSAWVSWVSAGNKIKRQLICQTIVCQCLTYSWVSYEKALDYLGGEIFGLTPDTASNRIAAAGKLCMSLNWDASKIRKA